MYESRQHEMHAYSRETDDSKSTSLLMNRYLRIDCHVEAVQESSNRFRACACFSQKVP